MKPENTASAAAKAPAAPPSAPSKRKLLVVDDDAVVRKSLGMKLAASGYQVVYATEVSEALEVTRRELPNVIILDINFPPDPSVSWDGFKLLTWLNRASKGGPVPVIIITSDDSHLNREKAIASGASGFFQKPLDMPSLTAAIQKLIEQPAPPE